MGCLTKHGALAAGTALSCAVLFAVPMVLHHRVYRETRWPLTSGDLVPLDQRISSVWCSGQVLSGDPNVTFRVYRLPERPLPSPPDPPPEVYTYSSDLRVRDVEYWAFYLHAGSSLNLSTCARLPGATLTVVRGAEHLEECLKAFHHRTGEDLSEESEESTDDDDGAPSSSISSSEGVITAEATEEGAFDCPHHSRIHHTLLSHFSCSSDLAQKGITTRYLETFELELDHTDFYYIIFSAGSILDLLSNQVFWNLDLQRTTPDLSSSLENCTSAQEHDNQCHMPLTFGSSEVCYVMMDRVPNGTRTPLTEVIHSSCEPRKALYFVFFLLIFLAIGFCAFQ